MAAPTETTVPVGASTTTALVDGASLSSYQLNSTVMRQQIGLADPQDAYGMANVVRLMPSGNEYSSLVRIAPGSPELQDLLRTGQAILAELQTLIILMNGLPATPLSPAAAIGANNLTTSS